MSFRKIIPLIFLFFAGAILGRPLALGSLGLVVKIVLYFERGWDFQYDSVNWFKGKILFSDAKIEQSKIFCVTSREISFDFCKKHLEFDRPHLALLEIPRFDEKGDWTLSMQQGTVEGLGFKKAQFCFEKLLSNELGRLTFEWDRSQVTLEAIQQGSEFWLQTELKNFETSLFKNGAVSQGILNGTCHLVFESNQWKRGAAHLYLEDVSYGNLCSGITGMVDWEGDGLTSFPSSFLDVKKICENSQEQLRLVLTRGSFHGPAAHFDKLKGNLSFKSGLGIKWEFEGEIFSDRALGGGPSCWDWYGRAFLHQERAHWIETELHLRDSVVRIRGEELLENIAWEIECEKIGALELGIIRPFFPFVTSHWTQWDILGGELNGRGKVLFFPEEKYSWNFSCLAENFSCRWQQLQIGCKSSEGTFSSDNNGKFRVDEGSFSFVLSEDKTMEVKKWWGKGEIEEGCLINSYFEGEMGTETASLTVTGFLDQFDLEVKTATAKLCLEGAVREEGLELVIQKGEIDEVCFSGKAHIDEHFLFSCHIDQFQGPLAPLFTRLGLYFPIEGAVVSTGFGLYMNGSPNQIDWSCQTKGSFYPLGQDQIFSFYCPVLEKKGEDLHFDFRVERSTWDLIRFCGQARDFVEFSLDPYRSHFLGKSVAMTASLDRAGLNALFLQVDLESSSLPFISSLLKNQNRVFGSNSLSGVASFSFQHQRELGSSLSLQGKDLFWEENPIDLDILAQGKGRNWEVLRCQITDLSFLGKVELDRDIFRIYEGIAHSKQGIKACFEGHVDASFQSEFHLSHVGVDLSSLADLTPYLENSLAGLEGSLEGEGCIVWKEKLEADFDFATSRLKAGVFEWENRGPLHFYYSSTEGISFSGIDFCQLKAKGEELPDFNCKVDLFGYDPLCSLWFLNGTHVHLTVDFLQKLPKLYSAQSETWIFDCVNSGECSCERVAQLNLGSSELSPASYPFQAAQSIKKVFHGVVLDQDIDFFADFCGSKDFSKISCCMKEGFIPMGGSIRHLEDLTLCFSGEELWAHCNYSHQGHLLKLHLDVDLDPDISGKLTFESVEDPLSADQRPLTVYWTHSLEKGVLIKEIEGAFSGLEMSFHALEESSSLIGSARFDCFRFAKMVPSEIEELFTDLKMGKGYELKGKLSFSEGIPSFSGLLSGKQFDLFGYQLRTLLARIELAADKVCISDLKISDSAAIVKVDEVIAASLPLNPWTISIPQLTILELRPSLLQKSGAPSGSISPLVVREFKMHNFKGLLDDSKTYTAQGELSFINSYRREHTVFDIPADLLGRIVGLDLELLIPACGDLSYEIREGKFFLKELKHSYSEGKRSEFFLVPTDPVPTMDFEGNLQILVKCKQFVLFKFMESFMISIEGELNDPKFHLQKKRRLWNF